ncbi:unnamed protein product [Prorocentrum cordatum]|uniref:Secreted protein n=1 Tax=Prorocentrum cordatum TaxID=2364126 RepID=A0ABN9RFL9_9DINO|nr:unnamed protein product [Polarella glacialis]
MSFPEKQKNCFSILVSMPLCCSIPCGGALLRHSAAAVAATLRACRWKMSCSGARASHLRRAELPTSGAADSPLHTVVNFCSACRGGAAALATRHALQADSAPLRFVRREAKKNSVR